MTADAELIELARSGERTALEELLSQQEGRMFAYAFRLLGNRADAEDVTQESLLAIARALPSYEESGQFRSWVFGIVYRQALKQRKKRRNTAGVTMESVEDSIAAPGVLADGMLMHSEQQRLLEEALQNLSLEERSVVLLRTKEELSFREIAAVMNCPLNTALGRMHKATKRLRELLGSKDDSDVL